MQRPLIVLGKLRRTLAHAMLALLLLWAQQHGMLHQLEHVLEPAHAKASGAPADERCHQCDAMAGLDSPLAGIGAPITADTRFAHAQPVPAVSVFLQRAAPAAYRSRAPPARA